MQQQSSYNRYQERLREQRKNPETSRAGLKWGDDEDNVLSDKISENESLDNIAKELQRTTGSIKTRLIIKAINAITNDNLSVAEATDKFKITEEDINDYKKKKSMRINYNMYKKTSSNTVVSLPTIFTLLLEINSKLDKLV